MAARVRPILSSKAKADEARIERLLAGQEKILAAMQRLLEGLRAVFVPYPPTPPPTKKRTVTLVRASADPTKGV